MITLDQVYLLEKKVESAVAKIAQLNAENDALRRKCAELTNALSAKTEQFSTFQDDQTKIEEGLLKVLERLNTVENSILTSGTSEETPDVSDTSDASQTDPLPAQEESTVQTVAEETPVTEEVTNNDAAPAAPLSDSTTQSEENNLTPSFDTATPVEETVSTPSKEEALSFSEELAVVLPESNTNEEAPSKDTSEKASADAEQGQFDIF